MISCIVLQLLVLCRLVEEHGSPYTTKGMNLCSRLSPCCSIQIVQLSFQTFIACGYYTLLDEPETSLHVGFAPAAQSQISIIACGYSTCSEQAMIFRSLNREIQLNTVTQFPMQLIWRREHVLEGRDQVTTQTVDPVRQLKQVNFP